MSVLPAEVQGALNQLLQALASPDNTLRTQAEEQLNDDWTPNRPDMLLVGLVEQIQAAQDPSVGRVQGSMRRILTVCRHGRLLQCFFGSKPPSRGKALPTVKPKNSS